MPSPRPEPPAFIIREAREADLPQLQALENVVFPRGVAYSPGAFRNQLQKFKAGFLVCVAQGKVIGYATAELWRSGTRFDAHQLPGQKHDPKGRTLYISSMAVYSGNQGRGIGRRLLHALLNVGRKRGCSKAKLVSRHLPLDFHPAANLLADIIKLSLDFRLFGDNFNDYFF